MNIIIDIEISLLKYMNIIIIEILVEFWWLFLL
jgi:hypothetical protein